VRRRFVGGVERRRKGVQGMINRIVLAFVFLLQVSAVTAADMRQTIVRQIQEPGICWDPDVEFPVPCDDDDD
jgi:hypothetical protein